MLFTIFLTAHIGVGILSVLFLPILVWKSLRGKQDSLALGITKYSFLGTTLSGVGLMLSGASISRTCFTLLGYSLLVGSVLAHSSMQAGRAKKAKQEL